MNLETNMPKLKGFINPLTKEGMRALGIVLGVIVVIAGIVYVANFGKRGEEVTVTSQPTIPTETPTITPLPTPLTEEETLPASPSPTRKVLRPTETPTSAVEGVTVSPAPTI